MKHLLSLSYFGFFILMVLSCTDTAFTEGSKENSISYEYLSNGYVYPLFNRNNFSLTTKSESFENDWENITYVTTSTGKKIDVPWNPHYSNNEIPFEIAFDIKKEDGWQLIFHTFTPEASPYLNYMIFHNTLTGLLKIFYYSEGGPLTPPNNNGIWELEFEGGTQHLLNFSDVIADPLNYGSERTHIYVSNLTKNVSKGFTAGWNCCQTELAYDPNFTSGYLRIAAHNLQTTNVNLTGKYESVSDGLIITNSTTNTASTLTQGLANLGGESAENWIKQKVSDGTIIDKTTDTKAASAILAGIAAQGVKAIVSFGINKVFGSFLGRFNKTSTTTQKIQLRTEGTLNISGTLYSTNTSTVSGVRLDFSTNKVGKVGAWNLTESPTVYIDPRGDYVPTSYGPVKEYSYQYKGISGNYIYNQTINPNLQQYLVSKWNTVNVISYSPTNMPPTSYPSSFDYGTLGNTSNTGRLFTNFSYEDVIYGRFAQADAIYENKLRPTVLVRNLEEICGPNNIPATIFLPKYKTAEGSFKFGGNYFLRFTSYFAININGKKDTIVSMKTFIPKLEWDPRLYELYVGGSY